MWEFSTDTFTCDQVTSGNILVSYIDSEVDIFFSFYDTDSFSLLLSGISHDVSVPREGLPGGLLFSTLANARELPFTESSIDSYVYSGNFVVFFPVWRVEGASDGGEVPGTVSVEVRILSSIYMWVVL